MEEGIGKVLRKPITIDAFVVEARNSDALVVEARNALAKPPDPLVSDASSVECARRWRPAHMGFGKTGYRPAGVVRQHKTIHGFRHWNIGEEHVDPLRQSRQKIDGGVSI